MDIVENFYNLHSQFAIRHKYFRGYRLSYILLIIVVVIGVLMIGASRYYLKEMASTMYLVLALETAVLFLTVIIQYSSIENLKKRGMTSLGDALNVPETLDFSLRSSALRHRKIAILKDALDERGLNDREGIMFMILFVQNDMKLRRISRPGRRSSSMELIGLLDEMLGKH